MTDLQSYTFYHGTSWYDANSIIKDKGFKLSISKIGSLGKGAYAFANDLDNAKQFAWNMYYAKKSRYHTHNKHFDEKLNHPVLKFKLKHPELVLDFTQPSVIETYNHFTNIAVGG